MKILFDENLSPSLTRRLADLFPGSSHVRDLKLEGASDDAVWEFAGSHGFVIASKDDDFHQRSFTFGSLPKVIGVLVGNASTATIEALFRTNHEWIQQFESDADAAYLALAIVR